MRCPCSSGLPVDECCGPLLDGRRTAATAEQLMRSRYTAFALGDAAHLVATWHPRTRPGRLELDPGMRWTGLEILDTVDGSAFHPTGVVEFRASYRGGELRERSRFERVEGLWVYVDGEFPER